MTSVTTILMSIEITLFIITILLTFIYLIPILLIRRFHNVNNVFTVNLCFAAICCDTYTLATYLTSNFFPTNFIDPVICFVLTHFGMMCTIQVPLALVEVSIHRLCSVVYHTKPFFKKKQWLIICISSQWTAGFIFSLPQISSINSVRISNHKLIVSAILFYEYSYY
jgi:hypothetical protein